MAYIDNQFARLFNDRKKTANIKDMNMSINIPHAQSEE
jgi:hypothetical protein